MTITELTIRVTHADYPLMSACNLATSQIANAKATNTSQNQDEHANRNEGNKHCHVQVPHAVTVRTCRYNKIIVSFFNMIIN